MYDIIILEVDMEKDILEDIGGAAIGGRCPRRVECGSPPFLLPIQ